MSFGNPLEKDLECPACRRSWDNSVEVYACRDCRILIPAKHVVRDIIIIGEKGRTYTTQYCPLCHGNVEEVQLCRCGLVYDEFGQSRLEVLRYEQYETPWRRFLKWLGVTN